MAVETPCQTSGAIFHTHISSDKITVTVDLGKVINLTDESAELLEANLHNALELVLAPYYIWQLEVKMNEGNCPDAPKDNSNGNHVFIDGVCIFCSLAK